MSTCCNTSVGVVITDSHGRLLMIKRADGTGTAPVAGHVNDSHSGWEDAARAEVREEVGLEVASLVDTGVGGWRHNRCGRSNPGTSGVGHEWRVYTATVFGTLRPDTRETLGARWYEPHEVGLLARATISSALGEFSAEQNAEIEMLEPVWIEWLSDLGVILASRSDIALADRMTRDRPVRTWVMTFASEGGPEQEIYVDLSALRRSALISTLAESAPDAVISVVAGTRQHGDRKPMLFRVSRLSGLRPA